MVVQKRVPLGWFFPQEFQDLQEEIGLQKKNRYYNKIINGREKNKYLAGDVGWIDLQEW